MHTLQRASMQVGANIHEPQPDYMEVCANLRMYVGRSLHIYVCRHEDPRILTNIRICTCEGQCEDERTSRTIHEGRYVRRSTKINVVRWRSTRRSTAFCEHPWRSVRRSTNINIFYGGRNIRICTYEGQCEDERTSPKIHGCRYED